jgi:4-hydroxy-tetrahydrodipicolinate synthase
VPVIAGAGANATAEAIELSKASEQAGASGLLHVTPYYNRPSQDGLYRHFEAVARSTRLPIVLYNVPTRTGCDLATATVERLAAIDNIVAIKDATGDVKRGGELIARVGDRMRVLSGDDFSAFCLFALGASGVISVVSNVVPHRVVAMWNAIAAGSWVEARRVHFGMLGLVELLFRETSPAPVKAALELLGKCRADMRLPLCGCSEALRDHIRSWLVAAGMPCQ